MNGNRGKRENNGQMLQLQQSYCISYVGDVNVETEEAGRATGQLVEVHW